MYPEAAMSETFEGVADGGVTSAKGVVAGARAAAAGVFPQCKVVAAPVVITRKHLAAGTAQAIVANSGCANAATGEQGLADAVAMAQLAGAGLALGPPAVAAPFLSRALKEAVDVSFNMIDVDSDTSTNDMVVVLANGLADGEISDGHA